MKDFLVVVDMQKDFVDGSLGTQEAQGIVSNVVKKIETFQGDILVTYDTHFEDYLDTAEGKKLPVKHCIKGSKGWELDEKVEEALKNKACTRVEKLKANFPEKKIIVDASCCAGVTPDTHNHALSVMSMCQIDITGK